MAKEVQRQDRVKDTVLENELPPPGHRETSRSWSAIMWGALLGLGSEMSSFSMQHVFIAAAPHAYVGQAQGSSVRDFLSTSQQPLEADRMISVSQMKTPRLALTKRSLSSKWLK